MGIITSTNGAVEVELIFNGLEQCRTLRTAELFTLSPLVIKEGRSVPLEIKWVHCFWMNGSQSGLQEWGWMEESASPLPELCLPPRKNVFDVTLTIQLAISDQSDDEMNWELPGPLALAWIIAANIKHLLHAGCNCMSYRTRLLAPQSHPQLPALSWHTINICEI